MSCCPGFQRFCMVVALVVVAGVCGIVAVPGSIAWADNTEEKKDSKMLRHVVMFQFKDAATKEEITGVVDAFRALPTKIPEIADFEFGTNNSPEGHNDGLTHCFTLSFKSEKDREVYLPHPAHEAFGKVLGPHLEKVVVIDYWAGK